MIYHSVIGVIHKGLWNHLRTLTFDSPLLLKLDSALSRENSTAAVANTLLFLLWGFDFWTWLKCVDALGIRPSFITTTKNKFSEIHISTPTP